MKSNLYHNKRMSVFKRWANKPYAAFNSFGKVIKIGALSVSCLMVALPAQAQEKKDTSNVQKVIEFDEVEVTGETAPLIYSQQSRVVTVITKKEIESAPAQNIQELLEYALNVDLRTRGGNDIQADISLRGGSFDQTLILLNGINVSDPQTGHFALNLPIDFESIERIEILYGPAARIFGANAFNGAINIITGTSEKSKAKVYASYGQHNLYNTGGSVNFISGKLKTFVAGNVKGSDGYIDNTDFNGSNLFYQGALKLKKLNLGWQAGYNEKAFGALTFYSAKYPNQYEENSTRFAAIKADFGTKVKFSSSIYYRDHHDHFVLFRDHPEWYQNFHINTTMGAKLRATTNWKAGKTSFGAELRNEVIRSNNLGEATNDSLIVKDVDGYYYNKKGDRTYISAFLDHSIFIQKLAISAGVLAQYLESDQLRFFPGIDASYRINQNLKVIASVNKSFRMPTFTDLYYNGPENVGNINLTPEESLTFEGGFKYQEAGFKSSASFFRRYGSNIIDWVKIDKTWHTENITELNTTGIETSVAYDFQDIEGLSPFLNNVKISYAYMEIDKVQSEAETKYALNNLKHNLAMSVDHNVYGNLRAVWQLAYRERNGTYLIYDTIAEKDVSHNYTSYFSADMRLMWQSKKLKLFVDVTNLFDADFVDYGSVPQPGRWVKIGASYTFGQ